MLNQQQVVDPVKIRSLFVPLDGTEWHERAISYGLLLSKWFGSTLDLFFSLADVPPLTRHGEWRQRAHLSLQTGEDGRNLGDSFINNGAIHEFGKILAIDYLNEITRRLNHLDVDIATDLSAGSPAHILSYKAQQVEESMIVMYARPQHRLRRYIRRKMAEELLRVATVPVLMINDDPEIELQDIQLSPESVVVPLRVERSMKACLPYAVAVAQKARVGIRIYESNLDYRRNRTQFDQARNYTFEYLDKSGIDYSIRSVKLGTTDTLAVAHRHSPFSWIVMGSRMRRGLTKKFLPSVADNIRREVACPVLVVPQAETIPKRRAELNTWLVDWLAHQDSTTLLESRLPSHTRRRTLTQRLSSLYTYNQTDPDEKPGRDR